MKRMSIRWRLTAWYGTVLSTVLAIFGAAVYFLMKDELRRRTVQGLSMQLAVVEDEITRIRDQERLKERLVQEFSAHPGFDIQVTAADGAIWLRSERIRQRGLPLPGSLPRRGQYSTQSFKVPDLGRFRQVNQIVEGPGTPVLVQVATSLEENDRDLAALLTILFLAGPIAVGGTLGGGYLLARKALAPVDRMAATADEITARDLHRRLDTPNPDDELGRLARTLNGMIARLERSFMEVRRFTADAAHELRTPLAVMRNAAEVSLRVPRESQQYRDTLEDLLEEIEHLTRLSESLLFLCREDAGVSLSACQPLRLDETIRDVTELMRVVADTRQHTLHFKNLPPCQVIGDPDQLRRLLINLIDNAIKYTPIGGVITVSVERQAGMARLCVADTGVGVAQEHLPHIFERFYRVDSARSREIAGTGLGLAICRSIAEAHQGSIQMESRLGEGTRVTVLLPLQAADTVATPRIEAFAAAEA